jgi:Flp pilus assembly pilin Flp
MKLNDLYARVAARVQPEDGQTMAEYGVVVSVITLGIILAIAALSGGISNAINSVTSLLP